MLHGAVAPSLPAFAVTHTLTGHFAEELCSQNVTTNNNNSIDSSNNNDNIAIDNDKQIVVIRHNHVTLYAINTSKTQLCKQEELQEEEEEEEEEELELDNHVKFHSANSEEGKSFRKNVNEIHTLFNGEAMTFVMECDLHAPPLDACVCRPSNVNIDLIMLLFDDFHISLIQYNPLFRRFDTVALIQLDDRGCALQHCTLPPLLRVDSTNTHIAVLVKRTELFYFTVMQRIDKRDAAAAASSSSSSYTTGRVNNIDDDKTKTKHGISENITISQNKLSDKVTSQIVQESQCKEINSSTNKLLINKEKSTKISFDAWGDDDDDDDDNESDSKNNESDSDHDKEKKVDNINRENRPDGQNGVIDAGANLGQKEYDDEEPLNDNNNNNNNDNDNNITTRDNVARKISNKVCSEECHDVVLISEITHIHLRSVNNALRNVRDVCFVESSTEPLLAVLYEKDPTWAGRVKLIEWRSRTVESNMLTCSVMWLRVSSTFHSSFDIINDGTKPNSNINYANHRINVTTTTTTTNISNKEIKLLSIGEVDYLPYDTTHMMALPARENVLASSVLCFSPSIIVHINTTSGFGVYINANGKEAVANVRQSANILYSAVKWTESAQDRSLRVVKTNLNFANCAAQLIKHCDTYEEIDEDNKVEGEVRTVDKIKDIYKRNATRFLHTQRLQEMELLTFTEDQGTVVLLRLHVVNHAIQSISVRIVMTECFCNSAAWLDRNVYFLGSANGDSRVIAYLPEAHERGNKTKPMLQVIQTFTGLCPVMDAAVIESTSAIEMSTRLAHARTSMSTNRDSKNTIAENEFLDKSIAQSPFASLYHEIILDPLRPSTLEHLSEGSGQMDVLLCSGVHGAGSLSVLRQSIRDYIVRREQINAVSLFYIECVQTHSSHNSNNSNDKNYKRPRDGSIATSMEMSNEFQEEQTPENNNNNNNNNNSTTTNNKGATVNITRTHLVMTGMDFTLLFTIRGDSVQQVLGTSIDIHSRTVFASYLNSVNAIVQVTETELRLISVDGKRLLHQVELTSLLHSAPIAKKDIAADEEHNVNETFSKNDNADDDSDITIEKVQSAFLLPSLSCVIILFANGILCKCTLTHAGHITNNDDLTTHDDDNNDNVNTIEGNEETPSAHLTILMRDIVSCNAWNEKEENVHSLCNSFIVVITRTMHLTVLSIGVDTILSIVHFPHFALMPQIAIADVPVMLRRMPTRLSVEPLPTITHIHVVQHHITSYSNTEEECSPENIQQCTNNTFNEYKESKITHNLLHPCSLVCILSSGEMVTYKFIPHDKYGPARLLKYIYHLLDIKPERDVMETIEAKRKRLVNERAHLEEETMKLRHCSNRVVPFTSIAGHRGVYVCGRHPVFLFWHPLRQEMVMCRHNVHNLVRGFAPFTSRHLRSGYVYCCEGVAFFAMSENDVMSARDKISMDSGNNNKMELMSNGWWLMKRIWLGATPHHAIYHGPSHCCFVIISTVIPFSPRRASFDVQLHIKYDEEGNASTSVDEPIALPPLQASVTHAPVPMNDHYMVHLYSCTSWRLHDRLELQMNEKVLTACEVEITRDNAYDVETLSKDRNTHNSTFSNAFASTRAPVCAVGTAFPLGEDITTRGRLLLLTTHFNNSDNASVAMEPHVKIKMLVSESMKGPVTALCGVQGDIALAIGGTLRVLHYDEVARKLETNALLYANIYVTALSSIKDYLLYGDLHYSAALCRYSAVNHTLTPLAKDVHSMSVVDCTSLYHQHALGLLFSDDQRNLSVMGYKPRVRLIANSSSTIASSEVTNTNTATNTEIANALFGGVTTSNSTFVNDNQTDNTGGDGGSSSNSVAARTVKERKVLESLLTIDGEYRMASGCVRKMLRFRLHEIPSSVILYITNTGEVGFVVALGEQTNQTAQWVSRRLQSEMCHLAGLPPKMFLGFSQDDPQRAFRGKEQLIHTPLLRQFFSLDLQMRKLVASSALTQLERVLNVGATIKAECNVV